MITGASSGIGEATALSFAREGAVLYLAARGEPALEAVAQACRRLGARATAVPADVTREDEVEAVAARASREEQRLDAWVNCASVAAFGRFLDVPQASFRRVVETNFFGMVHDSRAALSRFVEQEHGVLINVASVLGKEGVPYLSSYVSSKEAVIGLSASLREELQGFERVDVCTVLPSAIDTPIWRHAANYTGRRIQALKPVYDPELVARAIVGCARKPRRTVYVGMAGSAATIFHKLSARWYEIAAAAVVPRLLFRRGAAERSDGNLFEPSRAPTTVTGGWGSRGEWLDRAAKAGLALGALAAAASAAGSRRRRRRAEASGRGSGAAPGPRRAA